MHLAKPSEEIFHEVLRQTGVKAGETLFIDDNRDNIEAARRVGIHGFLETTGEEWTKMLTKGYQSDSFIKPSER